MNFLQRLLGRNPSVEPRNGFIYCLDPETLQPLMGGTAQLGTVTETVAHVEWLDAEGRFHRIEKTGWVLYVTEEAVADAPSLMLKVAATDAPAR